MAIYTAPTMSFINTYMDAARYRDENTRNAKKEYIEGMGNLVKGGGEAYKWQKRKDILDKAGELDAREKEILEELARLKGEKQEAMPDNVTAALKANPGWQGVPYALPGKEEDDFVVPAGLGILRRDLL